MYDAPRPAPRQVEILTLTETYRLELEIWQLYRGLDQRLGDVETAASVAAFGSDHHQHLIALRTRLALLGADVSALNGAACLRSAGQRLWSRVGSARSLLSLLARQEHLIEGHYRSVDLAPLSRASRALMRHAHSDERGHHAWLRDRVARLGARQLMPAPVLARAAARHWAHARL